MHSFLIPINDSVSSRKMVDFLINMPVSMADCHMTLLHVFRQPTSGEQLMGKKYMEELPVKHKALLEKVKDRLITEKHFPPGQIDIVLLTDPYPSVSEGIIEFFKKGHYDMVVIGRKKMSKSEEFVLGDISVKLVRSLDNTAILVVKTG